MALLRAYQRAYAGLPREVWLLSLVIFVNRCGTMVLPYLALYLRHEQGFTAAAAGRVLSVYGVGGIVGAQLGGRLTQRFGGVRVALVSMLLAVPGFLVIPWCGAGGWLLASLLYLSIAFEMMRPAIGASTIEFCPADRHARAFALNRLAMNLGMSIGPVIGGVLATIDYTLLFLVNGIGVAFSAAVLAVSFGLHRKAGRQEAVAPDLSGRSPWRDRRYLVFLGLQLALALVFFQIIGTLPLYWSEQLGVSEVGIGMLYLINTLIIVAVEMPLTEFFNRVAPLRAVAWGAMLMCVGFGATPLGELLGVGQGGAFAYACVLVPIWTLGEMLHSPFTLSYVAKASEGGRRGEYVGLFSTTMATALVLGPLTGTALYQIDPRLPWWACLAMTFVLTPSFLALARWNRRATLARRAEALSGETLPAPAATAERR